MAVHRDHVFQVHVDDLLRAGFDGVTLRQQRFIAGTPLDIRGAGHKNLIKLGLKGDPLASQAGLRFAFSWQRDIAVLIFQIVLKPCSCRALMVLEGLITNPGRKRHRLGIGRELFEGVQHLLTIDHAVVIFVQHLVDRLGIPRNDANAQRADDDQEQHQPPKTKQQFRAEVSHVYSYRKSDAWAFIYP